ncbi:MAG: antibiotic biosynthesis monooxygenase [Acidobacteria bacterium]|nr:antibiotic biosynthesis monooxygenase [Acidobacteriota bacterium]
MIVTCVFVHVKAEHVSDFIAASRGNHQGSVVEEGNLRFDVLQSTDDPTRFLLYEVYTTPEAAARHKATAHYLEWRAAVADWMATPRHGETYRVVYPADVSRW